jgi:predicted membrane protein
MSDQATPPMAWSIAILGVLIILISLFVFNLLGIAAGIMTVIVAVWLSIHPYWWWPTHAEDRLKAIQKWEKKSDVEKALEHFKEVK